MSKIIYYRIHRILCEEFYHMIHTYILFCLREQFWYILLENIYYKIHNSMYDVRCIFKFLATKFTTIFVNYLDVYFQIYCKNFVNCVVCFFKYLSQDAHLFELNFTKMILKWKDCSNLIRRNLLTIRGFKKHTAIKKKDEFGKSGSYGTAAADVIQ